jgi:FKBP-type peptidyl-prolyl cis-trans isomerase
MRIRPLFLLVAAAALSACALEDSSQPTYPQTVTFAPSLGVDLSTMVRVDTNLYYRDDVVGTGTPTAARGKYAWVYYTGYLSDGTMFETNVGDDSTRVWLQEAPGGVITGWVVGVSGMKPGGTRRLVIGSAYAYGSRENGPIPAHATLVFDVKVTRVE